MSLPSPSYGQAQGVNAQDLPTTLNLSTTLNLPTVLDWVPLKALTPTQREALPPGSCGAYIAPVREDADARLNPADAPIRAQADQSRGFNQKKTKQR